MRQNDHTGDVGRLAGIGIRIFLINQRIYELVHHVRMRSAVSCTLRERKVLIFVFIVHSLGCEMLYFFRQKLGKVRARYLLRNFLLWLLGSMYYQTYRSRGLLIGSGPIEAAHRLVLQKRMKLSGQKWTKKGAQAVANLRVVHLNQQWDRVINLINQHPPKAA
jgi:hypothetical protein